jgi:hypothetical protein
MVKNSVWKSLKNWLAGGLIAGSLLVARETKGQPDSLSATLYTGSKTEINKVIHKSGMNEEYVNGEDAVYKMVKK